MATMTMKQLEKYIARREAVPIRQRRYEVLTWDMDKQAFTPQQGVRRGPYTIHGLRRALRKLREMGYSCNYSSAHESGDPAVSVGRVDD